VTAGAVLRAIDRTKYDVLPIGITLDGRWADAWASDARRHATTPPGRPARGPHGLPGSKGPS
ncbi:hypothetical protein ABZ713_31710, partial [Streptomyces sp. NPDC006875]